MLRFLSLLLVAVAVPARVYADAALLLQEPYGRFGSMNPTGHAAVYLSRICAASPVHLRRCAAGEPGVVISRYHRVADRDWIAIPVVPYLYAVERAADVPDSASPAAVLAIRDAYRHAHLQDLVPDTADGAAPAGEWIELIGAAYDRRTIAFSVPTTPEQDDAVIAALNARDNHARFNLFFRNCADFARDVINLYYPKALRSSVIADLGLTTPKQIAKSLVQYGRRRGLPLFAFEIAQIPGSRRDSRGARGVLESLLKTKKYVVPLAAVQPWLPPGLAAGYLIKGRFDPGKYNAVTFDPRALEEYALHAAVAADE